jgi:hypothetical protein
MARGSDCGHGFKMWNYCARCCEVRAYKLSAVEQRERVLRAEVADLKRRVRIAREALCRHEFGVSGRLRKLYDLLDLRKPLPRRKR